MYVGYKMLISSLTELDATNETAQWNFKLETNLRSEKHWRSLTTTSYFGPGHQIPKMQTEEAGCKPLLQL